MRALALLALASAPLALAACGGDNPCGPDNQVACTCSTGGPGLRMCDSDHVPGACVCSPVDMAGRGADAAADAAPGGDGPLVDDAAAADLAASPDLAPPAADLAGPAPDLACVMTGHKRVFLSGMGTTADLKAAGGATDGLAGGDKLCQNAADAASLGGTFKAWLSSTTVDAIDRLTDVGPWYLVGTCSVVFANKAAITAQGPAVPIDRAATGAMAPLLDSWTGTLPTGRKDSFRCNDWAAPFAVNAEGTVGTGDNTLLAGGWTEVATNPCTNKSQLICFEQ